MLKYTSLGLAAKRRKKDRYEILSKARDQGKSKNSMVTKDGFESFYDTVSPVLFTKNVNFCNRRAFLYTPFLRCWVTEISCNLFELLNNNPFLGFGMYFAEHHMTEKKLDQPPKAGMKAVPV